MGLAAGDFLTVNLRTVVRVLGINETLAGVTLFAFGNGSSDLFSTFAAMSSQNGNLAVGELFGAALFITTVVAGSMAVISPFQVPKRTFVRDVGAFVVFAGMTLALVVDGELRIWKCGMMVAFYGFYVLFVVSWHWCGSRRMEKYRDEAGDDASSATESVEEETTPLLPTSKVGGSQGRHSEYHLGSVLPASQAAAVDADSYSLSPVPLPHLTTTMSEMHNEGRPRPRRPSWPLCSFMPTPENLASTLLPTLYPWRGHSFWKTFMAAVLAPCFFLLTITTPTTTHVQDTVDGLDPDTNVLCSRGDPGSGLEISANIHSDIVLPIDGATPVLAAQTGGAACDTSHRLTVLNPQKNITPERDGWNRWLICIQLYTAPSFLIYAFYVNMDGEISLLDLLRWSLCTILLSSVCLAGLLVFTTSAAPPGYLASLCFPGFLVSVAWISCAAKEIVGVMKAFGVILDLSDAVLGSTIFAVGNSCNDLVANIAVARRGLPIMALSACFGGPMFNTLLGIGLGGLYAMTQKSGERASYGIEVSTTLLVSGGALLIGTIGLLLAVSINGWWMDRKIGWSLIALWGVSTASNVILEMTGWSQG